MTSPGGASVELPPNALATPTLITIARSSESIPDGVGPVYQFGPSGTVFAVPVTVTLPFDPAAIPVGGTENDLVMQTAPDNTQDFESLGVASVDGSRGSAETTHFSLFGMAFQTMLPGGPAGGYVTLDIGGFSAQNLNPDAIITAALDATEGDVETSIQLDEFIFTAGGIPLGTCGGSFSSPFGTAAGTDVGTNLQLLDGGTVAVTMNESSFMNGLYVSSAPNPSAPYIGKTLSLSAPQATTIAPTLLPDLVVVPERPTSLSPAPNPQVIKGQPLTVTWTPVVADTMIITSFSGAAICHVDPAAGTFTIPGSTSTTYVLTGIEMILVNKRAAQATINGSSRSVLGYVTAIGLLRLVFSGGGG